MHASRAPSVSSLCLPRGLTCAVHWSDTCWSDGSGAAAADAGPALKRSASTPREHSGAAPPLLTAGLAAMSLAPPSPERAHVPPPLPLLPLPRDLPEECRALRRGASAVEVPSPRPAGGHAAAEGCAEGRLGGSLAAADNSRCGAVLACSPRVPAAYGRGGTQLKTHSLWKHDQRCAVRCITGLPRPAHRQRSWVPQ